MGPGELGVCPRCGWPLEGPDELAALRALADDLGIVVVDGTVSAMDAAGCSVGLGRVLLGGRAPVLAE